VAQRRSNARRTVARSGEQRRQRGSRGSATVRRRRNRAERTGHVTEPGGRGRRRFLVGDDESRRSRVLRTESESRSQWVSERGRWGHAARCRCTLYTPSPRTALYTAHCTLSTICTRSTIYTVYTSLSLPAPYSRLLLGPGHPPTRAAAARGCHGLSCRSYYHIILYCTLFHI